MHIPPDWGILLALVVSFIVFWFIFNRLFLQPFLRVLGERERGLRELGERASKLTDEAASATRKREAELAELRRDALARREAQRRLAESEAAQLMEDARAAAHREIEQAQAELENQLRTAERELEDLGKKLAVQLTERLLGRRLGGGAAANN